MTPRAVSRRSVVKLAYATPLVAMSMRIDDVDAQRFCPDGLTRCDCGDLPLYGYRWMNPYSTAPEGLGCVTCDPRKAIGPDCHLMPAPVYHSGDLDCMHDGRAVDCGPSIVPWCPYCGAISQP
jgi:hypothetical protein